MASTMSSEASESPVLSVISKRIRALRKKHNRIIQMEESVSQGKTLNKEQEETLRSKPYVLAAIDELEKLKQPISVAVSEEISTALREKQHNAPATNSSSENTENPEVSESEEPEKPPAAEAGGNEGNLSAVRDLLNLLYFGSMFDVKSQNDFTATMLTRTHERGCCLTYDYVTDDDAAELLGETDLDLISMLGGLLISRAVDSSLSHKDALRRCLNHAKLWIENSDHQVVPGSNITYAGLRQKLNKIMATDYFTATPEIKAPGEVAGYGSFQVPVHGPVVQFNMQSQVEVPQVQYELQEAETANNQGNGSFDGQPSAVDESYQGDEGENHSESHGQAEQVEQQPEVEPTSEQFDTEPQYVARRSNQNYRGGRGGGGGRRGYSNGRGGRGSGRGGAYTNGRNQYYEQGGGYYPRNNYYRGRGGRGGAGNNNNYQVGEGGYLVAN